MDFAKSIKLLLIMGVASRVEFSSAMSGFDMSLKLRWSGRLKIIKKLKIQKYTLITKYAN